MNDETLQDTYSIGILSDRVKELEFHVGMLQKQMASATRSLEMFLEVIAQDRFARMEMKREIAELKGEPK